MNFQFAEFDTSHFRAEPRRTVLGEWTVEHMSFAIPATADQTPIVFIGGAFQNAWSFLREVKHFMPQRPVVLVDLPGQGQNDQLSEQLSFADFALLLRRFFDAHGISKIVPVGLSYGSGIAYTFAQLFPDRTERLLLGGTTEQIRARIDQALRVSFWYLEQGRDDAFADAVIHHLLNLPHRALTGVSDRVVDSMRVGMLELTDVEKLRYRQNSSRLFTDKLAGEVKCPALVFTATHDHFTAPFEGLAIAKRCSAGQFVMIERGDHLAPVENSRTVIGVYDAFLNDRPVANVPGVRTGSAAEEATRERRMLERRAGRRRDVVLHGPAGESHAALLDYNAHGCLIELLHGAQVPAADAPVRISIPSIGAKGDAMLFADARGARAVFLHDVFNTLGKMPVGTVEMPTPSDARHSHRRISIAQRLAILPEE